MKKLFAILAVLFVTAFFAYAQDNGGSNCTASATGHFTFTVEAAIAVSVSGDVDLGGICPNCFKTYEQFEKCLTWTVTGGEDCHFRPSLTNEPDWFGQSVSQRWYFGVGEKWTNFDILDAPVLAIGNNIMKCVDRLGVDCYITPGTYTVDYTVQVDYVCAQ